MNEETHYLEADGYPVHIGYNSLGSLDVFCQKECEQGASLFLLADSSTRLHCLPVLLQTVPSLQGIPVIEIPAGEKNKNTRQAEHVWTSLLDLGADRKSILLNLGGGVVTDLGGFAAATFQRGIRFIHLPTTLLGMVDASLGGKTAVDILYYKNIAGCFANPVGVYIFPGFLKTLSFRDKASGFAEMIKTSLIADPPLWKAFASRPVSTILSEEYPPEMLTGLIARSLAVKNRIVKADFRETGMRKWLNFGHTVGHALESWSVENQEDHLLHGEAIAFGMIAETLLSSKICRLPSERAEEIVNHLCRNYSFSLPDHEISAEILRRMRADKKTERGKKKFVLLHEIGSPVTDQSPSDDDIMEVLQAVFRLTQPG